MAQSTYSLDMGGGGNTVSVSGASATTGPFTAILWVKPTSLGGPVVLARHSVSWRLQINGTSPRFFDGSADNTFSGLTLSTGVWTALAFRVSGTTCKCFVRPSGGSVSSESLTVSAPGGSPGNFGLGDADFGSFTLSGKCDHFQVYPSALSDADVAGLLAGTTDPAALSPRLWWKLEAGVGTAAADSSANGYTGTISGPTWSSDVAAELAADLGGGGSAAPALFHSHYQQQGWA